MPIAALCLAAAAPCGTIVMPNGIGQTDPSPVTSLNPLLGNSVANLEATILMFRPLVWIGADDRMDAARSLAQSVTALDGNRRIRVVLKDWRWSDGQPVTADDALFTWERIGKLGDVFAFPGGGMPDRVADVRVVDARTVDFVLKRPINPAWFGLNGLSQFTPLPRHVWGDIGRDEMWRRQTDPALARVVDGPFRLQTLALDRYASFTPNPFYGGQTARVARLVLDFQAGGSALLALQAGALDMAQVPTGVWASVAGQRGFYGVRLPEPFGYMGLNFNFRNDAVAFLRDARVRRALTLAADQKSMVALVYHGFSHENRVPVPVEPPTWRWWVADVPRYDPAAAEAELDGAGFRRGGDGVRRRDGVKLEFTVDASGETPERAQELEILQRNLHDIGVEMHIRLMSFQQLNATLGGAAGAWEAICIGTTFFGMPDGHGTFDTDGAGNNEGFSDPKMDALIAASVDSPGTAGLFAYEDYAAQVQPVSVLPQGGFPLLVANRVGGVDKFVNPQAYWAPEELWVRDEVCRGAAGGGAGD